MAWQTTIDLKDTTRSVRTWPNKQSCSVCSLSPGCQPYATFSTAAITDWKNTAHAAGRAATI